MGTRPLPRRASLVGAKAKRLLAGPGFAGQVMAALSTATYLTGRGGEILWVAREGLPVHRRCVLASFQPGSLCAGQSFFVQGPYLRIGKHVTIDLDQATEWEPSTTRPEQAEPLAIVNACLCRLLAAIRMPGNDAGLGRAIPLISAITHGRDMTFRPDSPVAYALSPILAIARACLSQDIVQVAQGGRELVGLGPGLTPAGDDFLGGVLFAAHSLRMAYPGEFPWEQEAVTELIDWAHTQTHPISHSILSDLALGHGPEPLHELVTSLLKGKDLARTMAGVTRLLEIGHTSGWDILAGVLTGMLLVAGRLIKSGIPPAPLAP